LPDVYLYTDVYRGADAGLSPGFGLALVAESTSGVVLGAEVTAALGGTGAPMDTGSASTAAGAAAARLGDAEAEAEAPRVPEDVGVAAAAALCETVAGGGCVDAATAPLVLTLMALGPADPSRVRLSGHVSRATVGALRLLRDFLGVTFRLRFEPRAREGQGAGTVVAACVGAGFANLSKKVT
jgi:RNA 3'-terminal phosphate cyclase-like protein